METLICKTCGSAFRVKPIRVRRGAKYCSRDCQFGGRAHTYSYAKHKGHKYYFTGVPCKRGHVSPRFVSSRACIQCNRNASRNGYQNAKDVWKERRRQWIKNNPEEYKATYKRSNDKRTSTPEGRIRNSVNSIICASMRGQNIGPKWRRYLGYTTAELRTHLERQFKPGMSWDNYGEWQIDHIIPRSRFRFSSPDDPEFRACWALSNLRPMWRTLNIKKRDHRTHLL